MALNKLKIFIAVITILIGLTQSFYFSNDEEERVKGLRNIVTRMKILTYMQITDSQKRRLHFFRLIENI